jgi:NADPH2:quinone reductase
MRAFSVRKFGEAPKIHDLPVPSAEGAFLIRVKYAGVNPLDYKLVERLTATSTYPFILGVDFAGVVERVPQGERDFRVGDRIFGMGGRTAPMRSTRPLFQALRQSRWRVFPKP